MPLVLCANDSRTIAHSGRTHYLKGARTAWTHASGERDASFLVSKTYVFDLGGRSANGFS